ncbi:hypothetical protein CRE_21588 [Caenorhabditis remanei]|uniref:SoHo domain-containing protein n=1 Tax=Caenorhabditis remanei TaxID=31234 RepID=E3NJU7_CAERE|nr:hypothetical protein CRE_21588 [Caenorhabditis remanei]
MHHPPSQFGSKNTAEPDPSHYPPQHASHNQNHPDSYDSYEEPNTFSSKGNVAALRNVIHGQLDMKTPTGNSSRYQKPAPPPVDPTPSWAKNVKVYEPNGYVDPHQNKHNMGRVLDGPVNPSKFFQGVPPPSYSLVKSDSKPPAPPSKPVQQTPAQALQAQVLQNENSNYSSSKPPSDPYRPPSQKTSYRIPYDLAMDPRHHTGEFDIDDSASIISSSCTFGESSEIAAFSAAAEQRHLYEQYRKKLMEEKNELKEGSETPCVSLSEKIPENTGNPEIPVSRSLFDTELTPFGHVAKPAHRPEDLPKTINQNTNNPFATPSPNPFNYSPSERELKRSVDLESSQLLVKPKSPAPYSTSSSDHFGTIRRKHKPVAIDLSEVPKSSPKDKSPHFFGNNYEEKSNNRSPRTPSYKDLSGKSESLNESLNQAFEIASSIESTKNNYEAPPTPKSISNDRSISDTYPVSSQQHHRPSPANPQLPIEPPPTTTNQKEQEPMSTSMSSIMSTSVPNMDESIVYSQKQSSPDSSPERNEDMSQWYRKMFKQMHKKGDEHERFDNNNRTIDTNLGRSQENLHSSPKPKDTQFFEHFEHGESFFENLGYFLKKGVTCSVLITPCVPICLSGLLKRVLSPIIQAIQTKYKYFHGISIYQLYGLRFNNEI